MTVLRALFPLACVALVAFVARLVPPPVAAQEAISAAIAPAPSNDREAWAVALLARLGNEQPSADTVAMVVEWTIAEDTSMGAFERGNPLNTTMPSAAETGTINSDGVKGYGSAAAGLDATVVTLTNGLYNDVVAALVANDAEAAKRALWASPWASSHYGYGVEWPSYTIEAQNGAQRATSAPISLDGDCGWNVAVALQANGGALQHISLAPGEWFSFNATVGDPAAVPYRMCAGIPAGNWCNLAARYAQVARAMGLTPVFQDHGVGDLGGGPENSVAIWNVGGAAGFENGAQDLIIQNTTPAPVTFRARIDGGSVVIEGSGQ